jgi:hypothetical protein
LRVALPQLVRDPPCERELLLEEVATASVTLADRVVAGLDHEPVGIRVELEQQFTRVLQHEPLGLGPGGTEVDAPAVNAKRIVGPAVRADRPEFGVLLRVAVDAVIAERGDGQQDANALAVGIVDEFADKVLLDVLVLAVVLPGHGVRLRTEPATHPEDQRVRPILLEALHGILPLRKAHERHAHEGDVVTAVLHGLLLALRRCRDWAGQQ